MVTQAIGPRRRSWNRLVPVALALGVGVIVLASQVSSVWSVGVGEQAATTRAIGPALDTVAPALFLHEGCHIDEGCGRHGAGERSLRTFHHLAEGCFIKYGCHRHEEGEVSMPAPAPPHRHEGCYVKYGCGEGGVG